MYRTEQHEHLTTSWNGAKCNLSIKFQPFHEEDNLWITDELRFFYAHELVLSDFCGMCSNQSNTKYSNKWGFYYNQKKLEISNSQESQPHARFFLVGGHFLKLPS